MPSGVGELADAGVDVVAQLVVFRGMESASAEESTLAGEGFALDNFCLHETVDHFGGEGGVAGVGVGETLAELLGGLVGANF